ncbi:hypothetical protein Ocin01_16451 [Orchesella cincta]|uniref:Uncharacterized protein n=1 Tax=Orchesella cincta TaxID=48709 RepID=A0A1D2MBE6_ORCCI|nr:hypothetical protein Ocin01_16451 [Orchesella cincta]
MQVLKFIFVLAYVGLRGLAAENENKVAVEAKVFGKQVQDKLEWVPKGEVEANQLIPAGGDNMTYGHFPLYVGRTNYNGEWVSGKAGLDGGGFYFYFTYNNQQLPSDNFEILTATPGTLSWITWREGCDVSSFPVFVEANTNAYICRGFHENSEKLTSLLVGIFRPGSGICHVPYSADHQLTRFEVLEINDYGRYIGVKN